MIYITGEERIHDSWNCYFLIFLDVYCFGMQWEFVGASEWIVHNTKGRFSLPGAPADKRRGESFHTWAL